MTQITQKFKYPECLELIKLKIIGEFSTASKHHDMLCGICGNIFNATPKSKMNNYKNFGGIGCPKCTMDKRFETEKAEMREKLIKMGFIFSDFRGKLDVIHARNTKCSCGRFWKTKPIYLLSGNSFCRPCNDDKKRKRFDVVNKIRVDNSLKYIHEYKVYRKLVRSYSYTNYLKNQHLFTEKRSVDNHLDHITPILFCYFNNIPPHICASIENLRIIPAKQNLQKGYKLPDTLPDCITKYLESISSKLCNDDNQVDKMICYNK